MLNKIEAIRNYAKKKLGDDRSGHDFYHVERVAKIAKQLAKQEKISIHPLLRRQATYMMSLMIKL